MISKIINAKPDAVFYSGYYAEGAPFDQQLVAKGYKGTFVGPDGVKDDQFIKQAGDASSNAYFTCPCVPGELIPTFARPTRPPTARSPARTPSRVTTPRRSCSRASTPATRTAPTLLDWVKNYDADGLSKHYKWDANGELQTPTVYGYKVDERQDRSVGTIA